jgi:hypothetical protein
MLVNSCYGAENLGFLPPTRELRPPPRPPPAPPLHPPSSTPPAAATPPPLAKAAATTTASAAAAAQASAAAAKKPPATRTTPATETTPATTRRRWVDSCSESGRQAQARQGAAGEEETQESRQECHEIMTMSNTLSVPSIILRHHLAACISSNHIFQRRVLSTPFHHLQSANFPKKINRFDSQSYFTLDTIDFFRGWQENRPCSRFRIVIIAV